MPAGDQAVGACAMVYDEPNDWNGEGLCAIAGTSDATTRYDVWRPERLEAFGGVPYGLRWKISSVSLFTPIIGATVVILYARGPGPYNSGVFDDGDFLLLDNYSGDRWNVNLPDLPFLPDGFAQEGYTWDDSASCMIVAHTARGQEWRISARTALTPTWNSFIDSQLASITTGPVTGAARDADPGWWWDAFPYWNEKGSYLRVYQPLTISLEDPFGDYHATVSYALKLQVASGKVTGFVRQSTATVASGWMTDFVSAVLTPYVQLGAYQLNSMLASGALSALFVSQGVLPANAAIKSLYYLPGDQRQTAKKGQVGIMEGRVQDDATIVLSTA